MSLAVIFPGQGSQYSGMLKNFKDFDVVKSTIEEASDILKYDLWSVMLSDSADKLNQTEYTQTILLASSVAMWRLWRQEVVEEISFFAGHSLGEYSALVCAGSLDFKTGLELVSTRAKLMQEAVPSGVGGMAAILGLDADTVVELCKEVSTTAKRVSAANFNSPMQIVIAGHKEAVDLACEKAKSLGAKRTVPLAVSVPSHCELMESAAAKLGEYIKNIDFLVPKIDIIQNYDVTSHKNMDDIKLALIKQLSNPVKWCQTIEHFVSADVDKVVECGPGKVLVGLGRRIAPGIKMSSLDDLKFVEKLKTEHKVNS